MDQVWDEKLLSRSTIKTLKRLKFTKMTPKQAAAIPLFLQRKDFAAEAVTEFLLYLDVTFRPITKLYGSIV